MTCTAHSRLVCVWFEHQMHAGALQLREWRVKRHIICIRHNRTSKARSRDAWASKMQCARHRQLGWQLGYNIFDWWTQVDNWVRQSRVQFCSVPVMGGASSGGLFPLAWSCLLQLQPQISSMHSSRALPLLISAPPPCPASRPPLLLWEKVWRRPWCLYR